MRFLPWLIPLLFPSKLAAPEVSMPWIRDTREAALHWWTAKIDTPYRWGGNEVKDGGFDCSGLTNGALRKFGRTDRDLTAQDLAAMFPKVAPGMVQPGDLLFWQSREPGNDRIVHVEAVWWIRDDGVIFSIGASGGGPWTTTLSAAQRTDARVKVHRASGWIYAVNPFD